MSQREEKERVVLVHIDSNQIINPDFRRRHEMDSVISPTVLFSSASLRRPNPEKVQSATSEQLGDVHVQIVLLKSIIYSFVFPSFLRLFSFFFFFFFLCAVFPSTSLWGVYSETFIHRYNIPLAHAFTCTRLCVIFFSHVHPVLCLFPLVTVCTVSFLSFSQLNISEYKYVQKS